MLCPVRITEKIKFAYEFLKCRGVQPWQPSKLKKLFADMNAAFTSNNAALTADRLFEYAFNDLKKMHELDKLNNPKFPTFSMFMITQKKFVMKKYSDQKDEDMKPIIDDYLNRRFLASRKRPGENSAARKKRKEVEKRTRRVEEEKRVAETRRADAEKYTSAAGYASFSDIEAEKDEAEAGHALFSNREAEKDAAAAGHTSYSNRGGENEKCETEECEDNRIVELKYMIDTKDNGLSVQVLPIAPNMVEALIYIVNSHDLMEFDSNNHKDYMDLFCHFFDYCVMFLNDALDVDVISKLKTPETNHFSKIMTELNYNPVVLPSVRRDILPNLHGGSGYQVELFDDKFVQNGGGGTKLDTPRHSELIGSLAKIMFQLKSKKLELDGDSYLKIREKLAALESSEKELYKYYTLLKKYNGFATKLNSDEKVSLEAIDDKITELSNKVNRTTTVLETGLNKIILTIGGTTNPLSVTISDDASVSKKPTESTESNNLKAYVKRITETNGSQESARGSNDSSHTPTINNASYNDLGRLYIEREVMRDQLQTESYGAPPSSSKIIDKDLEIQQLANHLKQYMRNGYEPEYPRNGAVENV
jgi:hypothetical protein